MKCSRSRRSINGVVNNDIKSKHKHNHYNENISRRCRVRQVRLSLIGAATIRGELIAGTQQAAGLRPTLSRYQRKFNWPSSPDQ